MGVYEIFRSDGQHLGRLAGGELDRADAPAGALAVQVDLGPDGHGCYRKQDAAWVKVSPEVFWNALRPALPGPQPEAIEVACHVGLKGEVTRTVLRGQVYVTETACGGALLNRAENTDRFWAGAAHMAFHLSWTNAHPENLKQAVTEALEEGHLVAP